MYCVVVTCWPILICLRISVWVCACILCITQTHCLRNINYASCILKTNIQFIGCHNIILICTQVPTCRKIPRVWQWRKYSNCPLRSLSTSRLQIPASGTTSCTGGEGWWSRSGWWVNYAHAMIFISEKRKWCRIRAVIKCYHCISSVCPSNVSRHL